MDKVKNRFDDAEQFAGNGDIAVSTIRTVPAEAVGQRKSCTIVKRLYHYGVRDGDSTCALSTADNLALAQRGRQLRINCEHHLTRAHIRVFGHHDDIDPRPKTRRAGC